MRKPSAPSGCPPAEDLTAHAHGEGDGAQRARIARHLLSCSLCRGEHEGGLRMLLGLREMGAAADVPATLVPATLPARPVRRRWLAWLPPAAAMALVVVSLTRAALQPVLPVAQPEGARASAPTQLSELDERRLGQLLASQAADGHWEGEGGSVATEPETATGLVLLALLHEAPPALRRLDVERAVREGSRWLAERAGHGQRANDPTRLGSDALMLAALVRSGPPSGATGSDPLCERLVERLAKAIEAGRGDPAHLAWVDYALALSEAARLPGARGARRELAESRGSLARRGEARMARHASVSDVQGPAPECTPVRLALESLRDEPPVRTLALGPPCRSGSAAHR